MLFSFFSIIFSRLKWFFFYIGETLISVLNFSLLKVFGQVIRGFLTSTIQSFDFKVLRKFIPAFSFAKLNRCSDKSAQRISKFTFSSCLLILFPMSWAFPKNTKTVVVEASSQTETWCFFARILNGIDPFDLSRWTPSSLYPKEIMWEYVLAPEFASTYSEWLLKVCELRVGSNIFFLWDIDGLTRLFLVLKLIGRYGTYAPELLIFGLLIFCLINHSLTTARIYSYIVDALQYAVILSLFVILLPFAPAELFTGYKADGYGELIKLIFLIVSLLYFSTASSWELEGKVRKEIYVITLFFLLFGLIMISCSNLWIFFFSLEGISFCIIIFFVFNFSGQGNIADAVRYFCLNSIASGALLLSIGLGQNVTNTTDYHEFGNYFLLNANIAVIPESFSFAVILFLIGSFFKLGVFPFNVYEIDTYKKSSYIVIYFSALISKTPFFFVWLKLVWRVIPFIKTMFPVIFILGLLTAIVGTLAALFQTVLRPFLAYSSMSHTGLILMSFSTETALGVDSALLYLLSYIFAMSAIYLTLSTLEAMGLDFHGVHQLKELRANFTLAVSFSISILTLAGFPPTVGFFAKVGILVNLAALGQIWVVILIFLLNLLSFAYYIRVLRVIWLETSDGASAKYSLTDIAKLKDISLGKTFFAVRLIASCLALFSITVLYSFKIIVALTGTLWCIANYTLDWYWFSLRVFANLKIWLFFREDRDYDFGRKLRDWYKAQYDTGFKPKPSFKERLQNFYARWAIPVPEKSVLNKKNP